LVFGEFRNVFLCKRITLTHKKKVDMIVMWNQRSYLYLRESKYPQPEGKNKKELRHMFAVVFLL